MALASWSSSLAALVHSVTPDEQYTSFGASLGFVGYQEIDDGGGFQIRGSVSLVDVGDGKVGHWAIGAAHTSIQTQNDRTSVYNSYRVGFANNFNTPSATYVADEIFIHPDYSDLPDGPDQALLYFETPILSVVPVKIFQGDYATLIGSDATQAGYGATGNEIDGFTGTDGNKRAGVNVLSNLGYVGVPDLVASRFRSPTSSTFRDLGILSGFGDSGGFYGIENTGTLEIIGVNSLAFNNSYNGGISVASLIDREWVSSVAASKSVPEPSFLAVFLIGGVFLLSRRKHPHRRSAKLECVDGNGIKSLA